MKFTSVFAALPVLLAVAKADTTVTEAVTFSTTIPIAPVANGAVNGPLIADNSSGGLSVNIGNFNLNCNMHCKMAFDSVQQNCKGQGIDCICGLSDDQLWSHVEECDCINPLGFLKSNNIKTAVCQVGKNVVANVANQYGVLPATISVGNTVAFATTLTTVTTGGDMAGMAM
ncbi:PGA61 Probable cell wall protein PGA61 [Candida maltosa Xu316]|uniref:Extracellular membrane protein CFEM domain-containing protein n=1 Tax=Candida maltosa (strain Xu316) TaxID=1245528 RepID=M3J7X1_CANMX|nr:hypothetical protein G210_1309 [Candida maltosa Xu316]